MSKELYQQVLMEHNRNPRNYGEMNSPTHTLEGKNPLCGDHLKLSLTVKDDRVESIMFTGEGCAISMASASLMTETAKGKEVKEIEETFADFRAMIKGELTEDDIIKLGKLKIFSGISEYPARVKCAILAWHTLVSALSGKSGTVATE